MAAEPPGFVDLGRFLADRGLDAGDGPTLCVAACVSGLTVDGRVHVASGATLAGLGEGVVAALDRHHRDMPDEPGLGLERLRRTVAPKLSAPLFRAVLRRLQATGTVVLDGAWVRTAGHSVALTPEDDRLWGEIRPLVSGPERFRPPRVRDIARLLDCEEEAVRRLFRRLQRAGRVDEVAHDHFFLRGTIAEIATVAREVSSGAQGGWFSAAQLRDRLDNGRKVAIQILEFFDRHGVTLRRGDLRRPNPHRQDLFQAEADEAHGGESSPVGRPDFKSGWGRETVPGGFDSHSPPPLFPSGGAP